MIKKKVTIAAEFISPLVDNDFDSFDMNDDNVDESLTLYFDWIDDLLDDGMILNDAELLDGDNDARLDTCEITNRLCDCFDVMITLKHFNEY